MARELDQLRDGRAAGVKKVPRPRRKVFARDEPKDDGDQLRKL
jgi:hypothetical protein